ncbi:hypothetical protein BGZ75_003227, partial [Mortierella antarctica]
MSSAISSSNTFLVCTRKSSHYCQTSEPNIRVRGISRAILAHRNLHFSNSDTLLHFNK